MPEFQFRLKEVLSRIGNRGQRKYMLVQFMFRPQTEYTDMARKSELNSSITIVEFSKSGTDYANVTKINKIN